MKRYPVVSGAFFKNIQFISQLLTVVFYHLVVIVDQYLVHKILTSLIRNKSDIHEQAFTKPWKKNFVSFLHYN